MAMAPRVLLTGMSGAGKSTVLAALAARGHRAVDLDDPGWSHERPTADGGIEQLWNEDAVAALLAEPADRALVLAGCAGNQGRFYDRLDAVLLLDVPEDVMLARLAARTSHDFGKAPAERARILADAAAVLPLLRASCTAILDATRPLDDVVDEVQRHLRG